ncbi:hypothetical protein ACU686_24565 [Yinghuangia aomiensis]
MAALGSSTAGRTRTLTPVPSGYSANDSHRSGGRSAVNATAALLITAAR